MRPRYGRLAERMRGEVAGLERSCQRAVQAWRRRQEVDPGERGIYLDSAALNLHGFYSGLERLFELIARHTLVQDGV